jgi:tryptophan synthase alpha chain
LSANNKCVRKGGADIIKIGIPFSKRIADGSSIDLASNIALKKGLTPEKALLVAKKVRKRLPKFPLLAMIYSNILVQGGMKNTYVSLQGMLTRRLQYA